MKLNVLAFALAVGILWGVGVFLMTWWLIFLGNLAGDPTIFERVYIGYTLTPLGSVIGLVWAFVDGFIAAGIMAWLYNKFAMKFSP